MWLTLVCMSCFLFSLGKQALENAKEVKLRQLEITSTKMPGSICMSMKAKQGKKKMEDAWQKSWE